MQKGIYSLVYMKFILKTSLEYAWNYLFYEILNK